MMTQPVVSGSANVCHQSVSTYWRW